MVDGDAAPIPPSPDNLEVITPRSLDISQHDFAVLVGRNSPFEIVTSMKPRLVRHLLNETGRSVLYVDTDQWCLGSLASAHGLVEDGALLLSPHLHRPAPFSKSEALLETAVLRAAVMNSGFVGVPAGLGGFVDWWADRLVADPDFRGDFAFVDQGWLSLVPALFQDVVFAQPGVNVGWWSMAAAGASESPDGRLCYLGDEVVLLNMSGFDPDRLYRLSIHDGEYQGVSLARTPVLARLVEAYRAALKQHDCDGASALPFGFERLPSGLKYDRHMRTLYRSAFDEEAARVSGNEPPCPFEVDQEVAFVDWLRTPGTTRNALFGRSRYIGHLCDEYPGLGRAIALTDARNERELFAALRAHEVDPLPGPELLTSPRRPDPPRVLVVGVQGDLSEAGRIANDLQLALRHLLGESELLMLPPAGDYSADALHLPPAHAYVFTMAPHLLPYGLGIHCPDLRSSRGLRVALSWWSAPGPIPRWYLSALGTSDRTWAPSAWCASLLSSSGFESEVVTLPCRPPAPLPNKPEQGQPWAVYSTVDMATSPEAASTTVRAYCEAFPFGAETQLTLVLWNAPRSAREDARLHWLAGWRSDVKVIQDPPRHEHDRLLSGCDLFASIAEDAALDLDLARAMAAGRLVVTNARAGRSDLVDASCTLSLDPADVSDLSLCFRQAQVERESLVAIAARAAEKVRSKRSLVSTAHDLQPRLVLAEAVL